MQHTKKTKGLRGLYVRGAVCAVALACTLAWMGCADVEWNCTCSGDCDGRGISFDQDGICGGGGAGQIDMEHNAEMDCEVDHQEVCTSVSCSCHCVETDVEC